MSFYHVMRARARARRFAPEGDDAFSQPLAKDRLSTPDALVDSFLPPSLSLYLSLLLFQLRNFGARSSSVCAQPSDVHMSDERAVIAGKFQRARYVISIKARSHNYAGEEREPSSHPSSPRPVFRVEIPQRIFSNSARS